MYDNITMFQEDNFVYTIPVEIGTPYQRGNVMVDINYPATIIFTETYTTTWNGSAYATASLKPWYLSTFYNYAASATWLRYSRSSYISNVQSCGFTQQGMIATDNFCLNNALFQQFCYNSVII